MTPQNVTKPLGINTQDQLTGFKPSIYIYIFIYVCQEDEVLLLTRKEIETNTLRARFPQLLEIYFSPKELCTFNVVVEFL